MLAKSRKLNLSFPEVRRLVRTFIRLSSPHLLVKYQNTEKPAAGMVVVSKQVDTRAVVRNELRRAMYEYVQAVFDQQPHLQIVIWAIKPTSKETLLAELSELIAKTVPR